MQRAQFDSCARLLSRESSTIYHDCFETSAHSGIMIYSRSRTECMRLFVSFALFTEFCLSLPNINWPIVSDFSFVSINRSWLHKLNSNLFSSDKSLTLLTYFSTIFKRVSNDSYTKCLIKLLKCLKNENLTQDFTCTPFSQLKMIYPKKVDENFQFRWNISVNHWNNKTIKMFQKQNANTNTTYHSRA